MRATGKTPHPALSPSKGAREFKIPKPLPFLRGEVERSSGEGFAVHEGNGKNPSPPPSPLSKGRGSLRATTPKNLFPSKGAREFSLRGTMKEKPSFIPA